MGNLSDVDFEGAAPLRDGYQAIPPGWYQLYMESSEVKDTSNNKGKMIACVFAVGTGEHEGAKIYCNFNFWNENQKTVDIAKSQWTAICEAAIGMPKVLSGDSSGLYNKTFMAKIDNVPGGSKVNGVWVEDPLKRKNEIVFNKGTIMGTREYYANNQPGAAATPTPQAASASTAQAAPAAGQATQAPAAANPAPTPVTPGVGKKPWDKR